MPGTLKLKSEAGGSVVLTANTNAATDLTVNISPVAGTLATLVANTTGPYFAQGGVAGNGPAFSAYGSSATSLTNGGYTKVAFQTKEFDTNSNFDNTTNYRFTPTVAGYYQVNAGVAANFSSGESTIYIYKNGSRFKNGQDNGAVSYQVNISSLIYLNGSSDYIEIYVYQGTGSAINTNTSSQACWFQASMVRSA